MFGDESATDARELQRGFVTLDNFYASAEISAPGWNWSTQANSNLFAGPLAEGAHLLVVGPVLLGCRGRPGRVGA